MPSMEKNLQGVDLKPLHLVPFQFYNWLAFLMFSNYNMIDLNKYERKEYETSCSSSSELVYRLCHK